MGEKLFTLTRADAIPRFSSDKAESNYRRGYSHGYAEAMDDMLGLMKGGAKAKFPRAREAWNLLARFYDTVLTRWIYSSDGFEPPKFDCDTSWDEVRAQVLERDENQCIWCGSTDDLECDHIIEVHRGGLPELENLRTLCRDCHRKRYDFAYIREKNLNAVYNRNGVMPL